MLRADGMLELDALYEMETDDGAILTVNNRVLIDTRAQRRDALLEDRDPGARGPYAWLNRLTIVGTLTSLKPEREAVLIRAFKLV